MPNSKPIRLQSEVLRHLNENKHFGDSYSSLIEKLLANVHSRRIISRHRNNWKELEIEIENTNDRPLLVIGTPGAGKTTIVRNLILNTSKESLYVVVDTHNEYPFLPVINMLDPLILKESCRFVPFENLDVSRSQVSNQIITPLMLNRGKFPSNMVLIVEEAGRYQSLNFFGNESRKFCKTLLITPNKLHGLDDTLESVKIIDKVVLPNRRGKKIRLS